MLDYKLDTLRSVRTPNSIRGYDLIQDNLNLVEGLLLAEQPGQHSLMTDAASQLFQAGGKRIRAAICLLTAGVFGADPEASLSLAAGIEMLHNATLVHDDLIDESVLRRGKPTLNSGQNAKFSVLIGDYFFARAANLVAETNKLDIMRQFAETLTTILNGEINQQFSRWRVDRQEYFDRIYAKTGAMFVLAAKSAATLGEADEQEVRVSRSMVITLASPSRLLTISWTSLENRTSWASQLAAICARDYSLYPFCCISINILTIRTLSNFLKFRTEIPRQLQIWLTQYWTRTPSIEPLVKQGIWFLRGSVH
jgi:hypothetical protein